MDTAGKSPRTRVKYSHHPDGRSHFSQDEKIFTAIKRQSIALDAQNGHLFTLLVQGLSALDTADPVKDTVTSQKRAVVDFEVEPSDAVKFVGRWFDVKAMRFSNPTPTIGPTAPLIMGDGITRNGIFIASRHANARHVLLLTCEAIRKLGSEPEQFMYYGGLYPGETMNDLNKEAGFLAFIYPAPEAEILAERIGSVDYVPK